MYTTRRYTHTQIKILAQQIIGNAMSMNIYSGLLIRTVAPDAKRFYKTDVMLLFFFYENHERMYKSYCNKKKL